MTMIMSQVVTKSQFKSQVLSYLRAVHESKQPLVVTHAGKPVVKITPYTEKDALSLLRNTVTHYEKPTEPVGVKDWETLR